MEVLKLILAAVFVMQIEIQKLVGVNGDTFQSLVLRTILLEF
jgi:hypothetical protein